MSKLSRRRFLLTSSAAAAGTVILHGCVPNSSGSSSTSASPAGESPAPAPSLSEADKPEVATAKLGFIALTDAAPLIIAKEKGFFNEFGMTDVEVLKQASWPVTRDNLELGSSGGGIDGAHILSPMPYLMTAGKITKQPVPMQILARLNVNGQAISVSKTYLDKKVALDSKGLKEALKGKADATAAITFPGGTHDLWMRYWLAAGGVDPTKDIKVIPIPPPQMVANMKSGTMDTFCVGEPWNAQLVNQKQGYTALVTGELWKNHPEKAFTMRKDWVEKNPKAAVALLKGIMKAQQWCEKAENKEEMCKIIAKDQWLKVPVEDIIGRSKGEIDYGDGRKETKPDIAMKFWADNASFPYKSHDLWFVTEDIRWGYLPADTDAKKLVDEVNRSDLWKEAAKALGVAEAEIPSSDSRGVEEFFDGTKFDPENPKAYLDGLKIKKA
ncbi:CmpA/NrtA family ABC transporter substrate-binding protein [Oscillatoria sp. FACHB-1406]|uniref:CmpA/NrtA family ABC transporter substrate-binding protein n=1 Tax=Oscillatoria sp. FACHB-1406 TaxID=2692846 RepID=UPI001685FFEF|nr:CmpA/NrtA family ABC transporter substrate-binding protein [Oscillatoria sp. FACHB-1406]MBD2577336.1 ABC transporter substrate-binding protein [Oscillatoria sp. FACHB-1406]